MRLRLGLLGVSVLCTGCVQSQAKLADAFPHAAAAHPWVLQNEVWSGPFDAAADALGDDAANLRPLGPTRVWLANYQHEREPQRRITVRAFAFESVAAARSAYERLRPFKPEPFQLGDGGFWTESGVVFAWGRLLFEIFSHAPADQLYVVTIASHIERQMPARLPDAPR